MEIHSFIHPVDIVGQELRYKDEQNIVPSLK